MNTVAEFAEACRPLNGYQIYMLFESGIGRTLRDHIYEAYRDSKSPEPTRSALIQIGQEYNVQSLIDF